MSKEKVDSQVRDKRKAKPEIKEEEEKEDKTQLKEKDSRKGRGKDQSEGKKKKKRLRTNPKSKEQNPDSFKTMLRHTEIKDQLEQQEFHIITLKLVKVQLSETAGKESDE